MQSQNKVDGKHQYQTVRDYVNTCGRDEKDVHRHTLAGNSDIPSLTSRHASEDVDKQVREIERQVCPDQCLDNKENGLPATEDIYLL